MFTRGKKESNKVLQHIELVEQQVILDTSLNNDFANQINIIELTKRDLAIAKTVQPFIKSKLEDIAVNFYAGVQIEPLLTKIINDNSHVDRLRNTMKNHIFELFDGKIDKEFIEHRNRIAHVHVRIGLPTKWYMGAFQRLTTSLIVILKEYIEDTDELIEVITTVTKLINLEQQLVLEAFEEKTNKLKDEKEQKKGIAERVSSTAENLSAITQETSTSVSELTTRTEAMLDKAVSGVRSSIEVQNRSKQGKERIDEHQEQMNAIADHTNTITNEIRDLKDVSTQIQEVVDIVKGIADQTNLLALNASIESARAGEHGKGFAVVADEVRKLAEQTKNSVSNVSDLIYKINSQITSVTEMTVQVNELVLNGFEKTKEISEFFDHILNDVKLSKEQSEHIETELKTFAMFFEEIDKAVYHLATTTDGLNSIVRDL